ncbi:MAG: class I SAM-dependent methyltransferase [Labilithrix sp.]|nr:class I SAM-dependent methyltransferase [Labilithrix sp.]
MDRARVWPDFRREHVLYEDDDVIAVHKPSGVPSQAADVDRDDLVARLRSFLAARDARAEPYLGVHQRLDRDTSGVVVFTKRPDVNAALARQFEGRTVQKRYVAAVSGWAHGAREVKLDDVLAKAEGGRMIVVERSPRGSRGPAGQRAVTFVKARARNDGRALLDLRLETGRTHQARVQLAHARAPIAGDPLYGHARAPRLLLHAASIELEHPRTRKRLVVRDPVPAEMERWLARGDLGASVFDDEGALGDAIALAVERRWALGRSARTTAFRLVNEEGDGLPGLAVDVYGDHLVAQLYVSEGGLWDDVARRDRVLDRLHALGFAGIYLKLRPKQANVLVDTRRDDLAPALPVRGNAAPHEIEIREEGMPFLVRLGDGLSTGLFLDQRKNRAYVRDHARGARVLNLFSYTCGFSVAAALGGASHTTSVDASMAALERGRVGFEAAGIALEGGAHAFAAEDVFSWLARAAKRPERYDLVVLDPPSYSSTKKRRFVVGDDYDELVALVAAVLAPGGRVLACANHRGLARARLRRLVAEGMKRDGRALAQLKDLPDGADYPAPAGCEPHMKSVLASLDRGCVEERAPLRSPADDRGGRDRRKRAR